MRNNRLHFSSCALLCLLCMCRADYRDWQSAGCSDSPPELVILQVSDTHIRNSDDAAWVQAKLQTAIAAHAPQRIIFTGDNTANGTSDEWHHLQLVMQKAENAVLIWGNHDMPLKKILSENPGQTRWEDVGNFRLIYLDTAWSGPFVGSYTSVPESELVKLQKASETDRKIILFAHHPLSDEAPHFVLRNAKHVRDVFKARKLTGVFTGHFHGAYITESEGVVYAGVAPFSAHQINHTISQRKGYRTIEVGKDCLRTRHHFVE